MLQCQIWGRGTENAGEWETHKGHRGKIWKFVAPYPLRVLAWFLLPESWNNIKNTIKFRWGQSIACLSFGANLCSVTCMAGASFGPISHPHFYTRVADSKKKLDIQRNFQVPDWWSGWGDMANLGLLALFGQGGGGCMGTISCSSYISLSTLAIWLPLIQYCCYNFLQPGFLSYNVTTALSRNLASSHTILFHCYTLTQSRLFSRNLTATLSYNLVSSHATTCNRTYRSPFNDSRPPSPSCHACLEEVVVEVILIFLSHCEFTIWCRACFFSRAGQDLVWAWLYGWLN
jgi:hypothetical protein